MVDNSNIDANVVIELALNKIIELQKQIILTEAKYITLGEDYKKLQIEHEVLKNKSEQWSSAATTRKPTTK